MNLQDIRSLRGQILATACLFAGCIPLSIAVVFSRPKFEKSMSESYATLDSAKAKTIQTYVEAVEHIGDSDTGSDAKSLKSKIASLSAEQKELLFQDWMQHRDPPRPATPRNLVLADEPFFLRRAQQSVVCGNEEQRHRAIEFLERCESPKVIDCFERLANWARQRRLNEANEQITAALERQRMAFAEDRQDHDDGSR